MSKIDDMIVNVLKHEGGFVNDPDDAGGATNFGITQATLSSHLGRKASINEVKNLSIETAGNIYKTNYYLKPRLNELPELIQPVVFDIAVNSGVRKAIKILQESLLLQGYKPGLINGFIGGATIKAAHDAAEEMGGRLVNAIVDKRISFYKSIADKNKTQVKFLNGWLARAESFRVDLA